MYNKLSFYNIQYRCFFYFNQFLYALKKKYFYYNFKFTFFGFMKNSNN